MSRKLSATTPGEMKSQLNMGSVYGPSYNNRWSFASEIVKEHSFI